MSLGPFPVGEKSASCRNHLSRYNCSDLVLLVMKWACTCAGKGDGGRGPNGLFESAAHKVAPHGVSFQAIFCRGEPSRVVREIRVVSGWR